jgi:hypothetical protein
MSWCDSSQNILLHCCCVTYVQVKKRQRLANLQLPVPTPADTLKAVAAGVVPSSSSSSFNTGAYGTRQFGIPDPTCGAVPEGCVAIRYVG